MKLLPCIVALPHYQWFDEEQIYSHKTSRFLRPSGNQENITDTD